MNKIRQETLRQVAAAHRASIERSLQHRLEVARAKGDENLIRLLEAEAKYIS